MVVVQSQHDRKFAIGTTTGALPAIDGSALTNLPASGITTAVSNTQVTYNFGASGNNYVITVQ